MKKVFVFFLVVIMSFTVTSCSFENYLKARDLIKYRTELTVGFLSTNDISRFEKRLEYINAKIISFSNNDNEYRYNLETNYYISDDEWQILNQNFDACIVDVNDECILTRNDIIKADFDGVCLNVYVDEGFYKKYDGYSIIQTNIKIDDQVFLMFPYEREVDDKKYIEYIERASLDKIALYKCAISFASESFEDAVTITITESTKKV